MMQLKAPEKPQQVNFESRLFLSVMELENVQDCEIKKNIVLPNLLCSFECLAQTLLERNFTVTRGTLNKTYI